MPVRHLHRRKLPSRKFRPRLNRGRKQHRHHHRIRREPWHRLPILSRRLRSPLARPSHSLRRPSPRPLLVRPLESSSSSRLIFRSRTFHPSLRRPHRQRIRRRQCARDLLRTLHRPSHALAIRKPVRYHLHHLRAQMLFLQSREKLRRRLLRLQQFLRSIPRLAHLANLPRSPRRNPRQFRRHRRHSRLRCHLWRRHRWRKPVCKSVKKPHRCYAQ